MKRRCNTCEHLEREPGASVPYGMGWTNLPDELYCLVIENDPENWEEDWGIEIDCPHWDVEEGFCWTCKYEFKEGCRQTVDPDVPVVGGRDYPCDSWEQAEVE